MALTSKVKRWILGLTYIVIVAVIWILASFVVQSVVDNGVSPFFITYICNSLFVVYIPIVEIGRYLEDTYGSLLFWRKKKTSPLQELRESEMAILLGESDVGANADGSNPSVLMEEGEVSQHGRVVDSGLEIVSLSDEIVLMEEGVEVSQQGRVVDLGPESVSLSHELERALPDQGLDAKGRWTRTRVAKVSLLICPVWFLAQLTFNLSLKFTTVTANTILSSASSLFTFLVSLAFLGEGFTWVKLISVLLCMAGTIIVSLGDSGGSGDSGSGFNSHLLGDILGLVSAALYAVHVTLIRHKLPDDDGQNGHASMAQFLGYMGLFNLLIFLPFALIFNFTKLKPENTLTWEQVGLIVGKGLLDNVLSDYLWAKAVLLTTTTVATAGLTIQVPLAAIVDSVRGNDPHLTDYLGAVAVMIGFAGINIPFDAFTRPVEATLELENENVSSNT